MSEEAKETREFLVMQPGDDTADVVDAASARDAATALFAEGSATVAVVFDLRRGKRFVRQHVAVPERDAAE